MTNDRTKRVDILKQNTIKWTTVSNGCCKARMKARPEAGSGCSVT